ncbi:MAG: twin-arginine translocase TatA/TatE family subunit [Bdellovibrionota bacterium]
MFGLGVSELLIIFGILILLFGASKIPALGKSLGEAVGGFRRGLSAKDEKSEPSPARQG